MSEYIPPVFVGEGNFEFVKVPLKDVLTALKLSLAYSDDAFTFSNDSGLRFESNREKYPTPWDALRARGYLNKRDLTRKINRWRAENQNETEN